MSLNINPSIPLKFLSEYFISTVLPPRLVSSGFNGFPPLPSAPCGTERRFRRGATEELPRLPGETSAASAASTPRRQNELRLTIYNIAGLLSLKNCKGAYALPPLKLCRAGNSSRTLYLPPNMSSPFLLSDLSASSSISTGSSPNVSALSLSLRSLSRRRR